MTARSDFIVAGIDPGGSGALCILFPDDSATFHDVPMQTIAGKKRPAWQQWARSWGSALMMASPDLAVIEAVGARPGQGVTSMFTFGRAFGFAEGIMFSAAPLAIVHQPTPGKWKPAMALQGADKNASREMVMRLLPKLSASVQRVKDDGRAEAALLALYGRKYL